MSKLTTLECYRGYLKDALTARSLGVRSVHELAAGEKLAAGRGEVPIDECIKHYRDSIAAMEAGADPKQFKY